MEKIIGYLYSADGYMMDFHHGIINNKNDLDMLERDKLKRLRQRLSMIIETAAVTLQNIDAYTEEKEDE